MKHPYTFSVLRYVHDALTQEFINVGVVLYCPQERFLGARITTHYSRISKVFGRIDGDRFRQLTRFLQGQISKLGERIPGDLPFEDRANRIEQFLAQVLPPDDSAFQFSPAGAGICDDPAKAIEDLYARHVELYEKRTELHRRTDEEVWRVYRESLDRRSVTPHLEPKTISAPDYSFEFKHAYRNGLWHVYEPVSFDLVEAGSIVDKANQWLGRLYNLASSEDQFQPYFLLGGPRQQDLLSAFVRAQNTLRKSPRNPVLVREEEADDFAQRLLREVEGQ